MIAAPLCCAGARVSLKPLTSNHNMSAACANPSGESS
jgi:hypothetical protein